MGRKYARIFVLGHYLFLVTHSFPRASLSENCSLLGIDNVRGQISVHIFAPNGGYCLYIFAPNGDYCIPRERRGFKSHLRLGFFRVYVSSCIYIRYHVIPLIYMLLKMVHKLSPSSSTTYLALCSRYYFKSIPMVRQVKSARTSSNVLSHYGKQNNFSNTHKYLNTTKAEWPISKPRRKK